MSTNNTYEGRELLLRIAKGDEKAMQELFLQYYRPLVFFATRILPSEADAEDIVSQTLGKIWDNRASLHAVSQSNAYLYTTVRNACIDFLRRQKKFRKEEVPDTFWTATPDDTDLSLEATKAEVLRIIHKEINALPDRCKQVFVLSYIDGLSVQEVADVLGISPSNVTSQRSRATQILKKSILDKQLWALFMAFFC